MPGKRFSLAQGMILIALIAGDLALLRALPADALVIPTIWILLALPNFVVVWKLILRRDCRAFHYTFPIVLLPAFAVLANLTANESLQILNILVGRFLGIVLDPRRHILVFEAVHFGEFWLDAALAALLAWAVGMLAARLETRRGWDVAAFWRGALLGLLAAALRTVPVVAGMITEVAVVAVGTIVERPAQRRGAASQKALEHLALAGGHSGSELLQIGRSPSAQDFVDG